MKRFVPQALLIISLSCLQRADAQNPAQNPAGLASIPSRKVGGLCRPR